MTPKMTPTEAASAYAGWLAKTRYSIGTAAGYVAKVNAFTRWVSDRAPEYDDCLTDEHVRDYAARDFRRELVTVRKYQPATVEAYLSAIGSFYGWLGMDKPRVTRDRVEHDRPRAIPEDAMRRVLRTAERRGNRDNALVNLLFLAAIRVSECHHLDVDDVFLGERKGYVQVRHGKGGKTRTVDLSPKARDAIRPYWNERRQEAGPAIGAPLFLSRHGKRLSIRQMQTLIGKMGDESGVGLSPHVLRHTFGVRWVESGNPVTGLQKVLGHANIQTTAGYARSSREALAEMSERVEIDL